MRLPSSLTDPMSIGTPFEIAGAPSKNDRIVTTRPEDRTRRSGTVQRDDAHYVYRRTGLPCRVCGTEVRTEVMVGRNLYWCPVCQAP